MKKHILLFSLIILYSLISGNDEISATNIDTRDQENYILSFRFTPDGLSIPTTESNRYNSIPVIPGIFSFSPDVETNFLGIRTNPPRVLNSGLKPEEIFSATFIQSAGLSGFMSTDQVSVFPNPSNGKFTVTWPNGILKVTVFNMLGNKVFSVTNTKLEKVNEIDLSKLQKGLYFMEIFDGNTIYSEKIVLQ